MRPGSIRAIAERALAEDIRSGDLTSRLTVDATWEARGCIRGRTAGVFAGGELVRAVYDLLGGGTVDVALHCRDGEAFRARHELAQVFGPARVVLAGERVALNFLQRLSGIATLTAKYVAAVEGTAARIADTRKTTPGLRELERHAVRCGGGVNHRFGLDDCVMIKDNHVGLCALHGGVDRPAAVVECVQRARGGAGHTTKVIAEVENAAEALAACEAGADVLLLDNFPVEALRRCVRKLRRLAPAVTLEASGGVSLRGVAAVAAAGVDVISVGALTHSAPALDIGMDIA